MRLLILFKITGLVAMFFLAIFFLSSCAANYKMINPRGVNYQANSNDENVFFSYKYNVLEESGNKKYAKKERKKNLSVVAVKLVNNKTVPIKFAEDVKIYSGNEIVLPVESEIVKNELKQIAPLYLLYSLLWVTIYDCDSNGFDCSVTPIPVGLAIGLGNMAVAGSANQNFLRELMANDILHREIQPGETVYGLIGVKDTGYNPLEFRFVGH